MPVAARTLDIVWLGLRWVQRHARRYLGPGLAVLLGTAGLILVLSTSEDVKLEFNQRLDLIGGATIFQVYFEDKPGSVPWAAEPRFFYWEIAQALKKLPGVGYVSLVGAKTSPTPVSSGRRSVDLETVAVDGEFWQLLGFTPVAGRFFTPEEVEGHRKVCVLGEAAARRLFDREDVVGSPLIIGSEVYEIVGVLGGFRVGEAARFLILPFSTALLRQPDMTLPVRLFIRCSRWEEMDETVAQVPRVVGEYLYLDRLRVEVDWGVLRRLQWIAYVIEVFTHVSVIVTLILGGVGIWSVMTASVRARTREIGIKKAIGAEDSDVLIQFLTESLAVTVAAIVPGIFLGVGCIEIVSGLVEHRPAFELVVWSIAVSSVISLCLGVLAGLQPSLKASRMEVTSTLRYE